MKNIKHNEHFRRMCFFCSEEISEKKTLEHVISNSLLAKLGIKEEKVAGEKEIQYSRVKVPAHSKCNNEFGSDYENRVLELLNDTDTLYEKIKSDEHQISIIETPLESATAIITTWLSKIYYGLFYYDLITTQNEGRKSLCLSIVNGPNFKFLQESYRNGHGFQLPSSLYAFKTNNTDTDLITVFEPNLILLKIKNLTFVLCICDGHLTKNYLNGDSLNRLREHIKYIDDNNVNSPSHKYAFCEILSLRKSIPKSPKFISTETEIINLSLLTSSENAAKFYAIDPVKLQIVRNEVFSSFNIKLRPL